MNIEIDELQFRILETIDKEQGDSSSYVDLMWIAEVLDLSIRETEVELEILGQDGYVELNRRNKGNDILSARITARGWKLIHKPDVLAHSIYQTANIFISHITEESRLASAFKNWIGSTFPEVDVFVSSEVDDIPGGSKWLNELDTALVAAAVFVVLCSPESLKRPWINFEMGCGWIKRVPVIPVCHSGQRKGSLPPPVSTFQALELENERFVDDFLKSLCTHLGLSEVPSVDEMRISQELIKAVSDTKKELTETNQEKTVEAADAELPSEAIGILEALKDLPREGVPVISLANRFDMEQQRAQFFVDLLLGRRLVSRRAFINNPSKYLLNKQGRAYLYDRGLL
ncbi:MAG: TIR domain-containing protein [Candidatus Aquicultorales bacterium]